MEICTFFTFSHVHQTCFAYNFFGALFQNLFNGFEISMKFCVFYTYLMFFKCSNFEAKCAKNSAKNKKNLLIKCV
jgi:hypothetical protein